MTKKNKRKKQDSKTFIAIAIIILFGVLFYFYDNEPSDLYVGYLENEGKNVYCRDSDGLDINNLGYLQLFDENGDALIDLVADYCIDDKNVIEYICFPEMIGEDGNVDPNTDNRFYKEEYTECLNTCSGGKCV